MWSLIITIFVSLVALGIIVLLAMEFLPKVKRQKSKVRLGAAEPAAKGGQSVMRKA